VCRLAPAPARVDRSTPQAARLQASALTPFTPRRWRAALLTPHAQVQHLGGRRLSITFDDGLVRELDFAGVLVGLLEALDDDDVFATASVDRVAGTVRWPNDIDLDPDERENRVGEPAERELQDLLRTALAELDAPAEQLDRLGLT
jgi:hypothetical protein